MPYKLVRDLVPEWMRQEGLEPEYHVAGRHHMEAILRNKMDEELDEVALARTSHQLIEELADVAEVVRALCRWHGVDPADVERARVEKADRKGGFNLGLVVNFPGEPKDVAGA